MSAVAQPPQEIRAEPRRTLFILALDTLDTLAAFDEAAVVGGAAVAGDVLPPAGAPVR